MKNSKIEVRDCKHGKGVFAKEKILPGEWIASFDGAIYRYEEIESGTEANYYVLQIGEKLFRKANGIAEIINHSCDPNCGVKNRWDIVAMRAIQPDEELSFDYEMTEDQWEIEDGIPYFMDCKCGSPICRKKIGSYKNLPPEIRRKYRGFISDYLIEKYGIS